MNTKYLTVMKKLGDGSIHPNDGDIGRQAALDTALLVALDATFAELILTIYEREHDEGERLATLEAALAVLDGTVPPSERRD